MYKIDIIPRTLHFKQPAGTSRGIYLTRNVWYLRLTDTETGGYGVGECAPLPNLSCDDLPNYEKQLRLVCNQTCADGCIDYEALRTYPSMLFGLETAWAHLQAGGSLKLVQSSFAEGKQGIPINGLIWMGSFDEMYQRIKEKMHLGFKCIKLKIGAIDFKRELDLLAFIRQKFSPEEIELRVDANGAFSPEEASQKLEQLSRFGLHSIEQPIRAGQWKEMSALCNSTPLSIGLDEELIGINDPTQKIELLETVRPQYLILKPSLHGGWQGCREWIELAQQRNIGYWITSALESNIGLNAIAQKCAALHPQIPQGLGTGMLFTDNIPYPLSIKGDHLWFDPQLPLPDFDSYLNFSE